MWQNQDLNTFRCQARALALSCHLPETGGSHAFFSLNYGGKKEPHEVGIITVNSQIRKLKIKTLVRLLHDHTASQRKSRDSAPELPTRCLGLFLPPYLVLCFLARGNWVSAEFIPPREELAKLRRVGPSHSLPKYSSAQLSINIYRVSSMQPRALE